jgi:hypothetical protein
MLRTDLYGEYVTSCREFGGIEAECSAGIAIAEVEDDLPLHAEHFCAYGGTIDLDWYRYSVCVYDSLPDNR